MGGNNLEGLKDELKEAAAILSYPERHLRIVLVIKKALFGLGIEPVLVGGGAVEFYTMGSYTTGDIDLVAPSGRDIDERLRLLGFKKQGKNRINDELGIFLEFPSASLDAGQEYNELEIGGGRIRIISIEDLIIDRLSAFKWWGSTVDGVNSLLLFNSKVVAVNRKNLEAKVKSHDLADAYAGIIKLGKRVKDGKIGMGKATDAIIEMGGSLRKK